MGFSIAGILSRVFVAVFWLISIIVVLILLDVPAAAFLPFATFVLSFSFAFGTTLKSILESLIMIFIGTLAFNAYCPLNRVRREAV